MAERTHLSIGEVLSLLREEFPDVTISKIRFLESQGLVDPERTPSGYRKFYDHDVERLRWILRQQRENFLPLKVIRGRLSEGADRKPPVEHTAEHPAMTPPRPPSSSVASVTELHPGSSGTSQRLFEPESPEGSRGAQSEGSRGTQPQGSQGTPPETQAPPPARTSKPGGPEDQSATDNGRAARSDAPAGSAGGTEGASTASSGQAAQAPTGSKGSVPAAKSAPPFDQEAEESTRGQEATSSSSSSTADDSSAASAGGTQPAGAKPRRSRNRSGLFGGEAAPAGESEGDARGSAKRQKRGPAKGRSGAAAEGGEAVEGSAQEPAPADQKPASKPEAPASKPEAPASKPEAPAAETKAPASKPEAPAAETKAPAAAQAPEASEKPAQGPAAEEPAAKATSGDSRDSSAQRSRRARAEAEDNSYTLEELAQACGMAEEDLSQLAQFGLIVPVGSANGTFYPPEALDIAKAASGFADHGIEARHLRAWRTSAEREASLFEQVVIPLVRQRNPESRQRAASMLEELGANSNRLHDALLRRALDQIH